MSLKDFLAAIDTPGGHILICLFLGMVGVCLALRGHDMTAASLLGFFNTAGYAMRGLNGKGQ